MLIPLIIVTAFMKKGSNQGCTNFFDLVEDMHEEEDMHEDLDVEDMHVDDV